MSRTMCRRLCKKAKTNGTYMSSLKISMSISTSSLVKHIESNKRKKGWRRRGWKIRKSKMIANHRAKKNATPVI